MATKRNKRKLAAVTRGTQEENLRNGQSRNMSVPRNNEEHIKQVFGEAAGRATKINVPGVEQHRVLHFGILGALSELDEFLLKSQIRTHSRSFPGTSRNTNVENQEPNEHCSHDDPHPNVGPSVYQPRHSNDSEPDKAARMMTGIPGEIIDCSAGSLQENKKNALHESDTASQWKHPCENWSRPDSVGLSLVGEQ